MKVLTTFIFAAKNQLGAQLLFSPWKNKLGLRPTDFFIGKIKVGHPTYLFTAKIKVVKTFMASNSLFILENKSWGYKSNPKQIPKSCGPRQSQRMCMAKFHGCFHELPSVCWYQGGRTWWCELLALVYGQSEWVLSAWAAGLNFQIEVNIS